METCPSCHTNAGVQHEAIVLVIGSVHTLTCPRCGYQVKAATIAEAVRKWNENKIDFPS